jgi:restriction endonuclease Mrr
MQKRLQLQKNEHIEVIGGIRTFEEYKNMNPHDFADEIIINYGGTPNQKKSGDKGIDGWTNPLITGERTPIQVKQWGHNVGVPCIDGFQSAIRRDKKTSGIIIAFGFSKSCYDEVEKIKKDYGIDIKLVEANSLLNLQK